jgi:hypothetical protein
LEQVEVNVKWPVWPSVTVWPAERKWTPCEVASLRVGRKWLEPKPLRCLALAAVELLTTFWM